MLALLLGVIVILGVVIGRLEKWSALDSMYFAFITATTVGYGDMRPSRGGSKIAAIFVALTGLILTGIIVAIALYALEFSLRDRSGLDDAQAFLASPVAEVFV